MDVDKKDNLIPPISLLEERLIACINRHKVGEIIIRKEVVTQIIEIPIRREKLIVEQISPEHKQIAIIDLDSDQDSLVQINETTISESSTLIVKSEFDSIKLAHKFLEAIANLPDPRITGLDIEIKVADAFTQKTCQEVLTDSLL
ncbi:DUF2382 domain-containing protein [Pseudanabaena sp. FACHB-1998]|uniref:DUF2382 domain-containing protein n=1 Tax=Pseudanabaena sp. FACHB-1998 TaxID=2692858 RepID=UPI001680E852|nr:DUF2382 domain-containing protein [Pseudanabaena sp. FACHB-1998]MBD2178616.1 DUF2382 domain-containing protein [Pseudanabaena sp. FACHB-1998]